MVTVVVLPAVAVMVARPLVVVVTRLAAMVPVVDAVVPAVLVVDSTLAEVVEEPSALVLPLLPTKAMPG